MPYDLPGLFGVIESHLTAAGAAQTPPISILWSGEPSALPADPVVAYWLQPIEVWEADTFSFTQRVLTIHWEVFFPGSQPTKAVNRGLELRVASIALAIEAEFMGDVTMGGYATGEGLQMTVSTPGYTNFAGQMCRSIGADVGFYLSNVAPIAP